MQIRPAADSDLDAILDIYNKAILTSTALWSDEPVERVDREEWLADHDARGNPVFVAEVDGNVAGFASYDQWRTRYGYRHTVEDSVYLRDEYHRRGLGQKLVEALIQHATAARHHLMIADIESGNTGSIELHRRLGFQVRGEIAEIGTKFGRWLDLTIMVRRLE